MADGKLQDSKACCTRPPISTEYTEVGKFVEIAGLKTYKTGPSSSKNAIVLIYDVFGFCPQILQGADLLASGKDGKYFQVYIPDFLEDNKADPAWFSNPTPEMRQAMGKYFGPGGLASAEVLSAKLLSVVNAIKEQGGIDRVGVVGYCWGAKIVSLNAKAGTPFAVAAEVHPSALTPSDASLIKIPIVVLASQDEDENVVKQFGENLTVPHFIDVYKQAPHGWMTTRGDLVSDQGRADFEKGYDAVINFFTEHFE